MKINEPHFKELNKCLKYSPLKIENSRIKGIIELKKFRVYAMHGLERNKVEVDISFKGQMHAYHYKYGSTWHDSGIFKDSTTSKIRVYRNIRNQTYSSVENFLTMFFGSGNYYKIKKVTWE